MSSKFLLLQPEKIIDRDTEAIKSLKGKLGARSKVRRVKRDAMEGGERVFWEPLNNPCMLRHSHSYRLNMISNFLVSKRVPFRIKVILLP